MISNLLTALGVAVLSMQTPTARPTAEPMRAYYDASQVSNYGTELRFYNYTSATLSPEDNQDDFTISSNSYGATSVDSTSSGLKFAVADAMGEIGGNKFYMNLGEYLEPLDFYVGGVFVATLTSNANGSYNLPLVPEELLSSYGEGAEYCGWLFDHQEANMSQTIIETAGDATTAAAAVIGAGFTGVINLFYNDGITGLGILALIAVGVSLVWFALALILRLWRGRR